VPIDAVAGSWLQECSQRIYRLDARCGRKSRICSHRSNRCGIGGRAFADILIDDAAQEWHGTVVAHERTNRLLLLAIGMYNTDGQVIATTALERARLDVCLVTSIQVHGGKLTRLCLPIAGIDVVLYLGHLLGSSRITLYGNQQHTVIVAGNAEDIVAGRGHFEGATHTLHIVIAGLCKSTAFIKELRPIGLG